jgi:hypothetical protein
MARRSTPERLHAARRAATVARLIGEGELPCRANELADLWVARAEAEGFERDGRFWDAGWQWIAARRSSRT